MSDVPEAVSRSGSAHLRPRIGVGVLLWRDDRLLLGERVMPGGDTVWQLPGGHLEAGESVSLCAVRELREETGIDMSSPRLVGFTDRPFTVAGHHYVTLFVSGDCPQAAEAANLEPERCMGWKWFPYDALPAPLFEPISILLEQVSVTGEDLYGLCRRHPGVTVSP